MARVRYQLSKTIKKRAEIEAIKLQYVLKKLKKYLVKTQEPENKNAPTGLIPTHYEFYR